MPYKDLFYKECKMIDFFAKALDEIKTQIEFYGYICEKDYKIFTYKAEKSLKKLLNLKMNLSKYKDEPSNLYLAENELIKILHIYYSTYKKLYPDCLKPIKLSINPITQNLENVKKNILESSVSTLKHSLKQNNKAELIKYLEENIELVMINAFKGLFNLHQLILIYSKKKNNLYLTIKNTIEQKINQEEINIVINDVTERIYAEKYKVIYEPIHFGNNIYKSVLADETNDVMELSKSFINYNMVFIQCIEIRKKIVKEIRLFTDSIRKKNSEIVTNIKKICEKITSKTKKLIHSSPGTINSWNLVFSSWNTIYTANMSYLQYDEEICSKKLTKHLEECNEEHKNFEKKWGKYEERIKDLRNKYMKYNNKKPKKEENKEKLEEENKEKQKREEKLKNYLAIDCTDFLDNNIPALRDNELKRINEIKDLADKFKLIIKKNLDEYLENTEKEYDNAASIDLFEEIRNMFENQLESLDIKDMDTYMDTLKEKISEINFNDNLAENARISLAEYYEHNDLEDGFDFSGGEIENPFEGNIIKDNDLYSDKTDDKEIIAGKIGNIKDEELSSIGKNDKNNNNNIENDFNEINYIKDINYKTPSFHENSENKNKNGDINHDMENNLNNLNIIKNNKLKKNINSEFKLVEEPIKTINENVDKQKKIIKNKIIFYDSKKNIENLSGTTLCCLRGGNVDINNEIDNINIDPNDKVEDIKEVNSDDSFASLKDKDNNNNINIINEELSPIQSNIKMQKKINSINLNQLDLNNEVKDINSNLDKNLYQNSDNNNIIKDNKILNNQINGCDVNNKQVIMQDNQNLHYGILCILGLFCLKSLFSSNCFFSADSFLNVVILGIISFIMYKTQFSH